MNKFISILLAGVMVLALASCGKEQAESSAPVGSLSAEGSISAVVEEEPEPDSGAAKPFGVGYYKGLGINPYTCTNAQNQTLVGLVYEPLFELDDCFEAKPCLADSITVKVKKDSYEKPVEQKTTKTNGTTAKDTKTQDKAKPEDTAEADQSAEPKTVTVTDYSTQVTVKLRKGVKFSDGTKLDADDVVYSMKRAAANNSLFHSRLIHISNVSASGKNAVTFTMDVGQSEAASLLTFPIVKNGTADENFPVGTGPYTPVLKKDSFKELKANPNWWRLAEGDTVETDPGNNSGEPVVITREVVQPVKRIRVRTYEDSGNLIFGFTSSSVSVQEVDFTDASAMKYTGDFTVTDYPTSTLLYLGCNTVKGSLCGSQKLRAGIYKAVDREMIATRMMARHALGTALPVSPKSQWYDAELEETLGYNPKKAKKLYEDAEVTGTLRLIVNQDSSFKTAAAEEIKQELESIGMRVNVEQLSWKEFKAALKEGSYDLYLGEVKLDATFDLSRLILKGGSLNYSKYSNSDLKSAMETFWAAKGEKKTEAAKEYFTQLAEKAPVIPLCFKNGSALTMNRGIKGLLSTQQNLYAQLWRWRISDGVAEASK